MYLSESGYLCLKVRSILRLLHYKSMGENWKASLWMKAIRNTLKHRVIGRLDWRPESEYWDQVPEIISCHKGSPAVFLAITFDRHKLDDENTLRVFKPMIRIDCYATWPFTIISWPWPWSWPRSNFQHGLLTSNNSAFDASRQEKHDTGNINVVALLSQKLLLKTFFVKTVIFIVFTLWRLNSWS